jgi:hypothetical protein
MANYALSDVTGILRAGEWKGWDDLLEWLRAQPANAQDGLSETDKSELIRDLQRARDGGVEFVSRPGELYRAIHTS